MNMSLLSPLMQKGSPWFNFYILGFHISKSWIYGEAIWKWLSDNLKSPLLQQILPHWNLQLQLDLKSRDASCNTPIPTWHGAHVVATCQYYSSRFKQRGSPPLKHNLAKPRARNNMLLNCHCVCSHQNPWIFTLSKAKSQKPFHACKSQAFPQENFHY